MRFILGHSLLLALLVSACSTTASTPSAVPVGGPTYPPDSIPFSEIDLRPYLLQPDDLPAYVELEEAEVPNELIKSLPSWDKLAFTRLSIPGYISRGLLVALYDDEANAASAFDGLVKYVEATSSKEPDLDDKGLVNLTDLGDKAAIHDFGRFAPGRSSFDAAYAVSVFFKRCHAAVWIDMFSPEVDADMALTYAHILDERLQHIACR
jgi:hypothetical protein